MHSVEDNVYFTEVIAVIYFCDNAMCCFQLGKYHSFVRYCHETMRTTGFISTLLTVSGRDVK